MPHRSRPEAAPSGGLIDSSQPHLYECLLRKLVCLNKFFAHLGSQNAPDPAPRGPAPV